LHLRHSCSTLGFLPGNFSSAQRLPCYSPRWSVDLNFGITDITYITGALCAYSNTGNIYQVTWSLLSAAGKDMPRDNGKCGSGSTYRTHKFASGKIFGISGFHHSVYWLLLM
jgi:hypothetical protein